MSRAPSHRCGKAALAAVGLALLAAAVPARGQIATAEDCARAATPEQEIACLRRALEQSQRALSVDVPQAVQAAPVRAEPPIQAEPPIGQAQTAPQPQPTPSARDLGREQVAAAREREERSEKRPVRIRSRIAALGEDPRGLLLLRLENGQVWRQTEREAVPFRLDQGERPAVEIARSGFGGYRMHFPAMDRVIVVRRVE